MQHKSHKQQQQIRGFHTRHNNRADKRQPQTSPGTVGSGLHVSVGVFSQQRTEEPSSHEAQSCMRLCVYKPKARARVAAVRPQVKEVIKSPPPKGGG